MIPRLRCLLPFLLLSLAACDDTTGPKVQPSPWRSTTLDPSLPDGALWRVAAMGDRALALGLDPDARPYVLEEKGGGWEQFFTGWPSEARVLDLAISAAGRAVAVGGTTGGGLFVSIERPTWTTTSVVSGAGALREVIELDDGSFLAVGDGGNAAVRAGGTLDGTWSQSSVALPGDPNEKALVSVVEVGGVLYACGFDDGGDGSPEQPFTLMMRDSGAGFQLMSRPCTECARYEFTTLGRTAGGGVLLGGAITNFASSDPADYYEAFLALYSPGLDSWTEIVLPESSALDRVNDILLASDGSLYLACGADGSAALVRQPPDGPAEVEWMAAGEADLRSLAERTDGSVLASGSSGSAPSRPVLLERGGAVE